MLFTDGSISRVEELAAHDSGLMDVASTEGIDVTGKIILAQEELGIELAALMPRGFPGAGLENVVVTPALKMWHGFRTLELFYRDAYNTQLNDRYKGKWEEYRKLGKWALEKLLAVGVGMAADPVRRAQTAELSAGTGQLPENTYAATMAWVNANGEEGAAAESRSLAIPSGGSLTVSAVNPPANARGWNVYVGAFEDALYRQNEAPLTLGHAWAQNTEPTTLGQRPGDGQKPGYLRALPRVLQRG